MSGSDIEGVRRNIVDGASKVMDGAAKTEAAGIELVEALAVIRQGIALFHSARNHGEDASEIIKQGYVQAATAGGETREASGAKAALDGIFELLQASGGDLAALADFSDYFLVVENHAALTTPTNLEMRALGARAFADTLIEFSDRL